MQFESFHWLSHHGIYMSHYTMAYKNGEHMLDFLVLGPIFWVFLIKQLCHSRLLDMR